MNLNKILKILILKFNNKILKYNNLKIIIISYIGIHF